MPAIRSLVSTSLATAFGEQYTSCSQILDFSSMDHKSIQTRFSCFSAVLRCAMELISFRPTVVITDMTQDNIFPEPGSSLTVDNL